MTINRAFFFRQIRDRLYPSGPNQAQVEGHDAILNFWEANHAKDDDRWLAYILATAYHESARTLQPVRETLANTDDQAIQRLERAWGTDKLPWVKVPYWRKDAAGKSWFGRGLVQLTFEANYEKLGKAIGVDLVGNPDLALDMDVAVRIIFHGMINGSFSGAALPAYFSRTTEDWTQARRIVNGLDCADAIAGYGHAYYAALSYTV